MQQNRQQIGGPENGQSETVLREQRFALVLCGDDALAKRLVAALDVSNNAHSGSILGDQNLAPSALQFFRFQKLYELWMGEAQRSSADQHIFQPGGENEAIEKGLDPSVARAMGALPSLHRALLLLIYGENFSYAATAQLLNISVEELMSALSAARNGFFVKNQRKGPEQQKGTEQSVFAGNKAMPREAQERAAYDTAC